MERGPRSRLVSLSRRGARNPCRDRLFILSLDFPMGSGCHARRLEPSSAGRHSFPAVSAHESMRSIQAEDLWSMDASRKSAILATKLQGAWEKRRKAADDWNASIVSGEARPGIARQLWWRIRALGNSSRVELLERSWRERAVYTPNLIWALMDTFGFQIWLGGLLGCPSL